MEKYKLLRIKSTDLTDIYNFFLNPVAHFLANPMKDYPQNIDHYKFLFSKNENILCGIKFQHHLLASLFLIRIEEKRYQIQNLFVRRLYRQQSLSKKLIQFSIKKLKKEDSIIAYIHGQQREQIRLFTDMGFIQNAKNKEFFFEKKSETFFQFSLKL